MRRVLVTGGTGFIGHHVLAYLLAETDWEVTALDSLTYAGDPDKVSAHARLTIRYHDLRAPLDPERITRVIGAPDIILNLASASHVDTSIEQPVPFFENNVAIALHMLEFARVVKPRLFVQFSTDEVYGPAPEGVAFAEWAPIKPSNPYAASKAAQEAAAIAWWRTYGVPVVITNTMNVFGEHQHPEKFIPRCIRLIEQGKAVTIHGERVDGHWVSGSRHWVYASDVADALRFLIETTTPARYPEADVPDRYNIVGADEVSNLGIARKVAGFMGAALLTYDWVDFHTSRPGHDRRYALSPDKLAAAGWSPKVGLDEGLRRTVASYRR